MKHVSRQLQVTFQSTSISSILRCYLFLGCHEVYHKLQLCAEINPSILPPHSPNNQVFIKMNILAIISGKDSKTLSQKELSG